MADSLHEKKLAEGVKAWNQWRKESPSVIPDLRYLSLPVSKKQFGPINGGPVNFRDTLLLKADLRHATLIQADLRAAELVEANLTNARLEQADLTNANLMDADLAGADLAHAKLDSADLTGANLALARNLTQEQINSAIGDPTTHLPAYLSMPSAWLQPRETWSFDSMPEFEEEQQLLRSSENEDLYAILGVNKGASEADLHAVFRTKAKLLHPDLNPNNPAADAAFRRLTHAYALLRNPERRARYDRGEIGPDGEEREDYLYRQWRARQVRRLTAWAIASTVLLIAVIATIASQFSTLVPWIMAKFEPVSTIERQASVELPPPVAPEALPEAEKPETLAGGDEAAEPVPPEQAASPSESGQSVHSHEPSDMAGSEREEPVVAAVPSQTSEPVSEKDGKTADGLAAETADTEAMPAETATHTSAIPAVSGTEPQSMVMNVMKERSPPDAAIRMIFEKFRPQPRFGPRMPAESSAAAPTTSLSALSNKHTSTARRAPVGPWRPGNCLPASSNTNAFKWVSLVRLNTAECPDPAFPVGSIRPAAVGTPERQRKMKPVSRGSTATPPATTPPQGTQARSARKQKPQANNNPGPEKKIEDSDILSGGSDH